MANQSEWTGGGGASGVVIGTKGLGSLAFGFGKVLSEVPRPKTQDQRPKTKF